MPGNDKIVVGLDEAGLGPLAGPIVFAAVGLPTCVTLTLADDSKKLTDDQRFEAAVEVYQRVPYVKLVELNPAAIEAIGAGPVWDTGFRTVLAEVLSWPRGRIIVDGSRKIRGLKEGLPIDYIVKADAKYKAVSAASVLAKCRQVVEMDGLDYLYPEYGFARHRGYGTAEHIQAIQKYGAVRGVHRKAYVETVALNKGFELRWRKK